MKTMTPEFVKRKSREFFENKTATLTVDLHNIGGEVIKAGEIVTILRKHPVLKFCLAIKSATGIEINDVWCENLILHKEKNQR